MSERSTANPKTIKRELLEELQVPKKCARLCGVTRILVQECVWKVQIQGIRERMADTYGLIDEILSTLGDEALTSRETADIVAMDHDMSETLGSLEGEVGEVDEHKAALSLLTEGQCRGVRLRTAPVPEGSIFYEGMFTMCTNPNIRTVVDTYRNLFPGYENKT